MADALTGVAAESANAGTPAPAGTVAAPVEDTSTLAEHEAAHRPGATAEPVDEDDEGRDDQGRFQRPRHRAKSQQATSADVPRIAELTKRNAALQAELEALKTPKSPSAQAPASPQAAVSAPTPSAAHPAPVATAPFQPQPFAAFDAWLEKNPTASYEDYIDARTDFRTAQFRAYERQQEQIVAQQRAWTDRQTTHAERQTAARAKYADYDTVAFNTQAQTSPVMIDAILQSPHSAEIQYFLGQHPDVSTQIAHDSIAAGPEAAAVMRRYLESFVASTATPSPSPRGQAAPTGSAALTLVPPGPPPPNPVRTRGAMSAADPPGDDSMSISDHEKFYGRRAR